MMELLVYRWLTRKCVDEHFADVSFSALECNLSCVAVFVQRPSDAGELIIGEDQFSFLEHSVLCGVDRSKLLLHDIDLPFAFLERSWNPTEVWDILIIQICKWALTFTADRTDHRHPADVVILLEPEPKGTVFTQPFTRFEIFIGQRPPPADVLPLGGQRWHFHRCFICIWKL